MSEERITPNSTTAALNGYLTKKYGYDLFDFALSAAIVLRRTHPLDDFNIWRLKKPTVTDLQTVQREIDRLVVIKDKLISDLTQHLEILSRIENPLFPKEILPGIRLSSNNTALSLDLMVRTAYGIDATLSTEIGVLSGAIRHFEVSRGAPSRPSNILGCLWSLIMRDQRRIHIEDIENLMDWFYERLGNTSYQEELNSSPALEEISRFMSHHRTDLENDTKKIFHIKYEPPHPTNKVFPYSIRFEWDEPIFSPWQTDPGNLEDYIIFPPRRNGE